MMIPNRDFDDYAKLLSTGDIERIDLDFNMRAYRHLSPQEITASMQASDSAQQALLDRAKAAAAQEIYKMRWGPTEIPVYNLLGLLMLLAPDLRPKFLAVARWLINTAKVPVDAAELSGTRALSHCFSTKPSFDLEYAQMLYDAGGDVNARNRYGTTVAHEIVQIYDFQDPEKIKRAEKGVEWFMQHGGNMDIEDGDGVPPRRAVETLARARVQMAGIQRVIRAEEDRRKAKGDACCALCGRDEGPLMLCGKCKKARYCKPAARACQKLHWPQHKKTCKGSA